MDPQNNNNNIQTEAFYMLGTLCFIFISVLIGNFLSIDTYVLSTILIFAIFAFKTEVYEQQMIAGVSYFTLMVVGITNSGYKGFGIMLVGLFLLSAVFYIYADEVMFDSEKMNIQRIRIRAGQFVLATILLFIFSLVIMFILELAKNSFLEKGILTGAIFGASILIESILKKEKDKQIDFSKIPEEYRIRLEQEKEKRNDALVKILSIWLLVIDFSIVSYVFAKNDNGFEFVATLICITILFTTFFLGTGKEDLYNVVYNKLRPFQAVAYLVLLIAHSDKIFTLFFFYAVIVCFLHVILVLNFINFKTFLTCVVVVYMAPVVGYFPNPIRLIDAQHPTVSSVLLQKADKETFWKTTSKDEIVKELIK